MYVLDFVFKMFFIGGNVFINVGGMCVIKYGVIRENVCGMYVVLVDGIKLVFGGKIIKDVLGYDLLDLFIGFEGILGIII